MHKLFQINPHALADVYILKRKLTRTVFSLELGSNAIKVRTLSGLPSIKVNAVNLPMCTSVKRIHKHVHFC